MIQIFRAVLQVIEKLIDKLRVSDFKSQIIVIYNEVS